MTTQEAIKRIKEHCRVHRLKEKGKCPLITKALEMAIQALEYRTPKKPIIGDTFSEKFQKAIVKTGSHPNIAKCQSYKCPVCHQGIIMLWEAERNKKAFGYLCKDNFCKKCGQALDWT